MMAKDFGYAQSGFLKVNFIGGLIDHIDARELHTLLWNGNPELANFSKDWKKIGV